MSKGHGFVTFEDPSGSAFALDPNKTHIVLNRVIVCKIGTHGENQKSSLKRKIFVGGIPPEARDVDLQEAFTGYDISDCCIMKNPQTGVSRGFGFVTLKEKAAVKLLFQNNLVNPIIINGKVLEIQLAQPRSGRKKTEDDETKDDEKHDKISTSKQKDTFTRFPFVDEKDKPFNLGIGPTGFVRYNEKMEVLSHYPVHYLVCWKDFTVLDKKLFLIELSFNLTEIGRSSNEIWLVYTPAAHQIAITIQKTIDSIISLKKLGGILSLLTLLRKTKPAKKKTTPIFSWPKKSQSEAPVSVPEVSITPSSQRPELRKNNSASTLHNLNTAIPHVTNTTVPNISNTMNNTGNNININNNNNNNVNVNSISNNLSFNSPQLNAAFSNSQINSNNQLKTTTTAHSEFVQLMPSSSSTEFFLNSVCVHHHDLPHSSTGTISEAKSKSGSKRDMEPRSHVRLKSSKSAQSFVCEFGELK